MQHCRTKSVHRSWIRSVVVSLMYTCVVCFLLSLLLIINPVFMCTPSGQYFLRSSLFSNSQSALHNRNTQIHTPHAAIHARPHSKPERKNCSPRYSHACPNRQCSLRGSRIPPTFSGRCAPARGGWLPPCIRFRTSQIARHVKCFPVCSSSSESA